jgi:hypothetical protein
MLIAPPHTAPMPATFDAPFGKRLLLPGAAPEPAASRSGDRLPAAAAAFAADERLRRADPMPTVVATSVRAGLLAGLVVSFLHASVGLEQSAALSRQIGTLEINGMPVPILPLVILSGLWEGARVSAFALCVVHALLRRLGRIGLADYAIGGGAVAALYAGSAEALGFGPPTHGWSFEIAAGLLAGLLYRLFAGVIWR